MPKTKIVVFKFAQSVFAEHYFFEDSKSDRLLPISFLFFLIEQGDRKILIDAGCEDMPGWEMSHMVSPANLLVEYGLTPDSITDVIITHAHHDHIQCVRHFKNAVIHIQREELGEGAKYITEGLKIHLFDDEFSLADNIKIIKIGGHTRGSSVVLLEKDGENYLFCGDEVYSEECFLRGVASGHPLSREKNIAFIEKYREQKYKKIIFHTPEILPDRNGWVVI